MPIERTVVAKVAELYCLVCNFTAYPRHFQTSLAKRHAKDTGHAVHMKVTLTYKYERKQSGPENRAPSKT